MFPSPGFSYSGVIAPIPGSKICSKVGVLIHLPRRSKNINLSDQRC